MSIEIFSKTRPLGDLPLNCVKFTGNVVLYVRRAAFQVVKFAVDSHLAFTIAEIS